MPPALFPGPGPVAAVGLLHLPECGLEMGAGPAGTLSPVDLQARALHGLVRGRAGEHSGGWR